MILSHSLHQRYISHWGTLKILKQRSEREASICMLVARGTTIVLRRLSLNSRRVCLSGPVQREESIDRRPVQMTNQVEKENVGNDILADADDVAMALDNCGVSPTPTVVLLPPNFGQGNLMQSVYRRSISQNVNKYQFQMQHQTEK